MERSARRLAALVPALLCALWSLVLTPPPASAADTTATPAVRPAAISSIPAPAAAPAPCTATISPAPATAAPLAPCTAVTSKAPAAVPAARADPVSPDPARTPPLPAQASGDPAVTPAVHAVSAPPAPVRTAPASVPAPAPAHRLAPPEPHLAPAAVAGLPAAVEHSVRFPAAPAAPAAAPVDLSPPPRGLLTGDPRRERAPPGGPYVPRDPRGPPSTRHR